MNSKNVKVKNNSWNIFETILGIVAFVATPFAMVLDVYLMFTGNEVVATLAMMDLWSYQNTPTSGSSSGYSTTQSISEASPTKQVGWAMNEFKDAVPAYKNKLEDIQPADKAMQSNAKVPFASTRKLM